MADRPISATGSRRIAPLYSQTNDIPEIAHFKVEFVHWKIERKCKGLF